MQFLCLLNAFTDIDPLQEKIYILLTFLAHANNNKETFRSMVVRVTLLINNDMGTVDKLPHYALWYSMI